MTSISHSILLFLETLTLMDDAFPSVEIDRTIVPHKVTIKMGNRPAATGEINEQNPRLHTGHVYFQDDRTYPFWYHTDEAKIYWDKDKGWNVKEWSGKKNHKGFCITLQGKKPLSEEFVCQSVCHTYKSHYLLRK